MALQTSPGAVKGKIDLVGTATRAAFLGCTFGFSICLTVTRLSSRPELPLYISALSLFHMLEFWITALYNPRNVTNQSFLLSSNGFAYWLAQLAGVAEYMVEQRLQVFWHASATIFRVTFLLGIVMILFGQLIRSIAMIQAAESFSHALAYAKVDTHVLVTRGLYS